MWPWVKVAAGYTMRSRSGGASSAGTGSAATPASGDAAGGALPGAAGAAGPRQAASSPTASRTSAATAPRRRAIRIAPSSLPLARLVELQDAPRILQQNLGAHLVAEVGRREVA